MNHKWCKKPENLPCDITREAWCKNPKTLCPYYASNLSGSNVRRGHPDFYKILEEMADLHSRKNADYANKDPLSNLRMCELGGIPGWKGVVVRLTDKISRLLTFMAKGQFEVKDESVEDSFKDAAVYAILGLILYRESKKTDEKLGA